MTTLNWNEEDDRAIQAIRGNPKGFFKGCKHWWSKSPGDNTETIRFELLNLVYEFLMASWHLLKKGVLWMFIFVGFLQVMMVVIGIILSGGVS
jgi:hypothetical protein